VANFVPLYLSVPTSGAGGTAAATYGFFSSNYKPPRQGRSTSMDIVHNQNGVFKYRYDNGPNIHHWEPFDLILLDEFKNALGGATLQWQRLQFLWNYVEGPLGLAAPEGVYTVDWASAALERQFYGKYPAPSDAKVHEYRVLVQFDEGG
jgi:hypothetical protein